MTMTTEAQGAVVAALLDALRDWLPRDADANDLAGVLGSFALLASCEASVGSNDRWQLAERIVRAVGYALTNAPTESIVDVMLSVEDAHRERGKQ